MDGVVVFADNKVLEVDSFENKLFNRLKGVSSYSVLPVCSIQDLESTIKAISTFKAIILDWNFKNEDVEIEGLEGAKLPDKTPEQTLDVADIYSLIYIYSETELGVEIKTKLQQRYGQKVQFKKKTLDAIDEDAAAIIKDIKDFEEANKHMAIPFIWSHAINQSVQRIFYELEKADPHWIKEIRDTAEKDGGEPTSEIIDVFHHILNESLIQNKDLRTALDAYVCEESGIEENTAKLYRRIYYSQLTQDAPIMTGDIFQFGDEEYGILITPECEVNKRELLYFLIFKKSGINEFLAKNNSYNRGEEDYTNFKPSKKDKIRKVFNNEELSIHILPSFPFSEETYNTSAYINFKEAFTSIKKVDCETKRTRYKLNAPFIHQLRQRYVAFFGKYGVPAIPQGLRDFNLR